MADADTSQSGAGTEATQTTQTSLLDGVAPEAEHPEWFFADGVKGTGAPPEFFNSKKYKTLADQAKAQRELEKKLGSFTGAPEKYETPEGAALDEAYMAKLVEFGKKHNMSQEAFSELVKQESEAFDADVTKYLADQKAAIGQDADKRLGSVAAWAKANLDEAGYNELREAVTSAAAFKVIERIIGMTRQAPLPKVDDTVTGAAITPEQVRALHNELDAQGRRKYDIDPDHRKKVKEAYEQMYGNQPYFG